MLRQELQQADSLLLEEAAKIGARRIFIDGVGRLVTGDGTPESRSAFYIFTEGLQRENLTALLAVEAQMLVQLQQRFYFASRCPPCAGELAERRL